MMPALLDVLLACGVALAPARAADDPCSRCAGVGRIACPKHEAGEFALEKNAVVCTYYAGCATCAGTGGIDCADCEPANSDDAWALERVRDDAVKRLKEYQTTMARRLLAAASRNFNLVCELEPMKVGKKRTSKHALLHLYLDRLEAVQRDYLAFFELDEDAITARSEFFLWANAADHKKAGEAFCFYTPVDPAHRRGLEARTSIHFDTQKMGDDDALHRNVVHQAVHGIMNVQEPIGYTGKLHMGWADEGLSFWFEDRLLGAATGFCFYPFEELKGLRGGRWRPALYAMVAAGDPVEFEAFLGLDSVDMTREQNALGFSLIDFLARDPARLNRLLKRLRARTPARDAIKEVEGLSLEEFEAAWRAWVAQTYPKK